MKKTSLLAIFFMLIFSNCQKSIKENITKNVSVEKKESEKSKKKVDDRKLNLFLNEIGLNPLLFSAKTKWEDVDSFYVVFLKNEKWQKSEFVEQVKQICYLVIIKEYGLDKDKSEKAQEKRHFYLLEMQKTNFVHPILAIRLLDISSFSNTEKQEYAKNALEKSNAEYDDDLSYFEKNATTMNIHSKKYYEEYEKCVKKLIKLKS